HLLLLEVEQHPGIRRHAGAEHHAPRAAHVVVGQFHPETLRALLGQDDEVTLRQRRLWLRGSRQREGKQRQKQKNTFEHYPILSLVRRSSARTSSRTGPFRGASARSVSQCSGGLRPTLRLQDRLRSRLSASGGSRSGFSVPSAAPGRRSSSPPPTRDYSRRRPAPTGAAPDRANPRPPATGPHSTASAWPADRRPAHRRHIASPAPPAGSFRRADRRPRRS